MKWVTWLWTWWIQFVSNRLAISLEEHEIASGTFDNDTERVRLSDMKNVRSFIIKALQ